MEELQLQELMEKALNNPEDSAANIEYIDAVLDYLDKKKTTNDILSIIIEGIDIDRAANYYDYFTSLEKKEVQNEWKIIKKNSEIKKNGRNALKFITGILTLCFLKEGYLEGLCGDVVCFLVDMIDSETKTIVAKTYTPVINAYFLEDLGTDIELPKYDTINAPYRKLKRLGEIIVESISEKDTFAYMPIMQWSKKGIDYCNKMIEKQKIEENIPKSRIDDLKEIVEHYQKVESIVRDDQYEIASLHQDISELQKSILNLENEKQELKKELDVLNLQLHNSKNELMRAENEVAERKAINDAFDALKENDIASLYKDIASDLKSIYQDFIETQSDEMDVELGEIYRDKIQSIFRILKNKGIEVGESDG